MAITSITDARDKLARLRAAGAKLKEERGHQIKTTLFTAAGAATALGVSYLEHRYPERTQVGQVDMSAILSLATFAGIAEMLGSDDANQALLEFGRANLYVFMAKKGAEMGEKAKNETPV